MTEKKVQDIFIEGAIAASFIGESIAKHGNKTAIGAHSIFLGQVRSDAVDGNIVAAIEYTTYRQMADEKMNEIREFIFAKYPLNCLHVYHSLGKIAAGEICLFVLTSSVHRKLAIAACEELVEKIKSELPVWGKEIFADNSHQWKVNK